MVLCIAPRSVEMRFQWFWERWRRCRWHLHGGVWLHPTRIAPEALEDAIRQFTLDEEWMLLLAVASAKAELNYFEGLPPRSFAIPQTSPAARGLISGPALFQYELTRAETRSLLGKSREVRWIIIRAIRRRSAWSFASGS